MRLTHWLPLKWTATNQRGIRCKIGQKQPKILPKTTPNVPLLALYFYDVLLFWRKKYNLIYLRGSILSLRIFFSCEEIIFTKIFMKLILKYTYHKILVWRKKSYLARICRSWCCSRNNRACRFWIISICCPILCKAFKSLASLACVAAVLSSSIRSLRWRNSSWIRSYLSWKYIKYKIRVWFVKKWAKNSWNQFSRNQSAKKYNLITVHYNLIMCQIIESLEANFHR